MKKKFLFPIIVGLVTLLSACSNQGSQSQNSDTQKSASKTAQSFTADSSSEKSQGTLTNHKKSVMNFEQIKMGDYGSIAGDWKLVKATAKNGDITDSTQVTLTVSKDSLSDGQITVNSSGLTDNNGNHQLNYQKGQGALVANLANDAAINYTVKFYPTGTTNEYNNGSKNIIVIWTSNNNYTEVFEQENSNADDSSSTSNGKNSTSKKDNSLWNASKDAKLETFVNRWSKTMNQDYQKYDGTNEIKTNTGMYYPRALSETVVDGQKGLVGWSSKGDGNYTYNVVAIYNHNGQGTLGRITYAFAFKDGKPIVLVDQSTNGDPIMLVTQNAKLKAGFDGIAKN